MNQQTIRIVTGSVRPGSVSESLLTTVTAELRTQGFVVETTTLREINLPFFDAELPPADPNHHTDHQSVAAWHEAVVSADALVLLTPEYNDMPSAAQKNALDWLYAELHDKPVAQIGYGWRGAAKATALIDGLLTKLKARPLGTVGLIFPDDLSPTGELSITGHAKVASVADLLRAAR